MIRALDQMLDHVTMYRLVLYYLSALLLAAFVLSLVGLVPHRPAAIAVSAVVVMASGWITNTVFARVFAVPANGESVYITALILVLILDPVTPADPSGLAALALVSVWATASKYILAVGRKHLFNPAAIGVVLAAFLLDRPATWWVGGNLPLLPFVLAGGVLVVVKLRRLDLVATFILVALATMLATAAPGEAGAALGGALRASPLLFFAFVMLTEPLTAPTMRRPRIAFAALVGVLFAPDIHVGSLYFTPELALIVGNAFAYAVGPRGRFVLTLERIERSAADTYDFVFRPAGKPAFEAGQYLEWTLPVTQPDARGNRRYFTVASAPTEGPVRLGVKFYPAPSAFKRALRAMAPGDTIHAAQVAGSFTLPSDRGAKLAFLAGGIGITPFRSMLQYLVDRGERRAITVLYAADSARDIAYRDVLEAARRTLGIETVYALATGAGPGAAKGRIDADLVRRAIPDYRERTFYISGPQAMVTALRRMLRGMGVRRSRIKVDFFPGLA
jgi:ferredoxin-NADP reductase